MDLFLVPVAKSLPKRLYHYILKIDNDLLGIVLIHFYFIYNEIENCHRCLFYFLLLLISDHLAELLLVLSM